MPYGAPVVLPSIRNAIINGDAAVAQAQAVAVTTNVNMTGNQTVWNNADMFGAHSHGTGAGVRAVTDSQEADHPVLGAQGFCKSLQLLFGPGAPAAGEAGLVCTSVEGHNFALIAGLGCILTFWVKSPLTGIHCVALTNNVDRSYVLEYPVYVANTWEQKIVGLVFNAVGGTWNYTNGIGIRVCFPLFVGANFRTTPNAWMPGIFYGTANQQNLFNAIGNTFRVTDVQLEQGLTPTSFERLPFDIALNRCGRYYQQSFDYGVQPVQALGLDTGELRIMIPFAVATMFEGSTDFAVSMRDDPVVTLYNPFNADAQAMDVINLVGCNNTAVVNPNPNRLNITSISGIGPLTPAVGGIHFAANARI